MAPAVRMPGAVAVAALAVLLLVAPYPASATNFVNLPAFSGAGQGMAGADSVSVLDTSLINSNPGALFLLPRSTDPDPKGWFDGGVANFTLGYLQPFLHHTDQFGSSRDDENIPVLAVHGGFAAHVREIPRLTVGVGLFTQGGLGTDFRSLNTAFGTRDDSTSFLRHIKLAFAVSYEIVDGLSIGIAPHISYADFSFRVFPKTSAGVAFSGVDIGNRCQRNLGLGEPGSDCPWDVTGGAKVGVAWKVTPMVTVGLAYTSPANFHFHSGEGKLNFSSLGLGRVSYDVDALGFQWAQRVEAGLAVRPTPRLLLALDASWDDWSANKDVKLRFNNPRSFVPDALRNVTVKITHDWKDQFMVALGAAYDVVPNMFTVRGGYNWASNPLRERTFDPAVQVPFEHHIAVGAGWKPWKRWELDAGFYYALPKKVTYANPELPYGTRATENPQGFQLDVTMGYRF
jgi:long-chain fatty acid transport protein